MCMRGGVSRAPPATHFVRKKAVEQIRRPFTDTERFPERNWFLIAPLEACTAVVHDASLCNFTGFPCKLWKAIHVCNIYTRLCMGAIDTPMFRRGESVSRNPLGICFFKYIIRYQVWKAYRVTDPRQVLEY